MCITSVSYTIKVNNNKVGPINAKRGLRQGCPLSPYLFVICAHGLSSLMSKAEARGAIHGARVCRRAPSISHLMFADDCILFFRAEAKESNQIVEILQTFEAASGQVINLSKSGISFSRNVSPASQADISSSLGVCNPLNTGKYLGLPSLIGSKKKAIFAYLKDRLWKKIQGWNGRPISKAGREVLIKSVAQAIPAYCMQVFLLPVSLADELQRMMNSYWWGARGNSRGISWTKWDHLCVKKKNGGMGFRNLHGFNLAMLGKQGWDILSNPNTLVSQVLKAKYFPDKDFLKAYLGFNPSFIWRSIWCSQALLRGGYRWRIGDGSNISVWTEPWLRNNTKPRVESQIIPGLESLKVADLMIPFTREWDIEFIEENFCERDTTEITAIPLMLHAHDLRIWSHSKDGTYTVRSGYHLAMNIIYTGRGNSVNGEWDKLWDLNIPPKVKNLAWRTVRNWLPTRINLQSKRVMVPSTCANCDSMLEQPWHLFYTCQFAQACWEISAVKNEVNQSPSEIENFADWFFHILGKLDVERKQIFVMTLWGIWHSRNERVWNNTSPSANWTITHATDMLKEWLAVRMADSQLNKQQNLGSNVTWRKPLENFLKCNVDAGFDTDKRSFAVGMVIRDSNGSFIICKTSLHHGTALVKEAEALAIHEALSWIKGMGYDKVIVESDSKTSVDAIHSEAPDLTEFGLSITVCRALIRNQSSIKIEYIRRQANRAAHTLVKTALQQACFGISYVVPTSINSIIMDECRTPNEVQ